MEYSVFKIAAFVASTCLLSFLPLTANAYTISSSEATEENLSGEPIYKVSNLLEGDHFQLDWSFNEGSNFPTFESTAIIEITNITPSKLEFEVNLKNTTPNFKSADGKSLRASTTVFSLEAEGFSSGSLSVPGTWLRTFSVGSTPELSNQFCAGTQNSCTSGTYSKGIRPGLSSTFSFSINGTFNPDEGVTLKNFETVWNTNYQNIVMNVNAKNNFKLSGVASELELPEPSMLPALVLACAGLWVGIGRKST